MNENSCHKLASVNFAVELQIFSKCFIFQIIKMYSKCQLGNIPSLKIIIRPVNTYYFYIRVAVFVFSSFQ